MAADTTDRKMENRAKRRVKAVAARLERDAPLFVAAGLERAPTIEEAAAQIQKHDDSALGFIDRVAKLDARHAAEGAAIRTWFATRLPPHRMEVLDVLRGKFLPPGGTPTAGYWRGLLSKEPFPIGECCGPAIAEVHEAVRAFWMRDNYHEAGHGALRREADALNAWTRHLWEAHGEGWPKHVYQTGCRGCRNAAQVLYAAECEEVAGFGIPGRLDSARRSLEQEIGFHRRVEARPVQEALGIVAPEN